MLLAIYPSTYGYANTLLRREYNFSMDEGVNNSDRVRGVPEYYSWICIYFPEQVLYHSKTKWAAVSDIH